MAVNTITFGGVNSADYGIYISGEGVFNAPVRDTEMVSIPGRNGSFLLDNGRFENIKVTYPAFNVEPDMESFVSRVDAFRNAIVSKKGYQRLTDTFHPDEYRLATFIDGFEMEPVKYNTAGRFELSFDCKPQRFLFSGEEVFTLGEWGQTETKSGSVVSFEGDETTAIKSLTAQIVPKQSGSGDPSPSNVRPISGWDSIKVTKCGKNLIGLQMDSATIFYNGVSASGNNDRLSLTTTNTSTWQNMSLRVYLKAGTYTLSIKGESSDSYEPAITIYNSSGSAIAQNIKQGSPKSFTLAEYQQVEFRFFASGNPGAIRTVTYYDVQLELGSTATAYEPYQGTSYPISLGQTVYGGVLDVVSGKLTITHEIQNLKNRSSNYTVEYTVNNKRGVGFNYALDKISTRANGWCDHSIVTSETNPNLPQYMWFGVKSKFVYWIGILDVLNMTLEEFKTWQSSHDVYIVDERATPIEVTLTPTEVQTLLGQNNIWADSGDVTVEIGQNPYILVNPTLFEACPLIEFNSSGEDGEINLGSRQIKVLSAILGRVNLGLDVSGSKTTTRTWQDVITVQNAGSFNAGDTLRFNGGKVIFTFNYTPINVEVVSQGTDLKASWQRGSSNLELSLNNLEFPAGTDTTDQFTCDIKVKASETPSIEGTETFTVTTSYNRNGVLTITWAGGNYSFGAYTYIQGASNYTGYGDSTKNSLEDVDIYVDLDIGEAYSVDSDDNVVSLNNFVNLGGELPTLDPGATEISTDDSISNVKVTPRWWKV